ncbi:uncharacterized protein LOC105281378 isoform X1 [Ooceraea biroi]|uniref:uncharacterized protein LOC105281378 isoform X1 n=2 Tax=Ooceraea biroi TaxID=2015173 RepID=UPI000F0931D8|nr:uncharacterized protein LOC105281378 isoform X1 [Ooceraea biroi]
MENKNEYMRQIVLFHFCKGHSVTQTGEKIRAAHGPDAIRDWIIREWFRRFRCGDFTSHFPRPGRRTEIDVDQIKAMIESNPSYRAREIAETLKISKSSVVNHLHKLGYVKRCNVWLVNDAKSKGKLLANPICNEELEEPKFGLHSKNILRVPRLRKNARIKRWGPRYHMSIHNAVFRKHCLPYTPTERPANLSEEIMESDPLYVCKHCKDCFRFRSSFEDHYKRRSWILGLWCQHCFVTVCTHTTKIGSACPTCSKTNADKRAYLRSQGLLDRKFGVTKIFYNQCQLFEHMKMHGITLVDIGDLVLMPIPAGMSSSNWTAELEIACEAIMEHTFILCTHVMDWLRVFDVQDKWWKLIDKNDNVIGNLVKKYQGREVFKKLEKSTTNQFTHFISLGTDVSKSPADEFDDTKDTHISDKNVTENEDNPCMSNDIAFVDCGSMIPHYFESESSVEPESLVKSKLVVEPELSIESELPVEPETEPSYVVSKKCSTNVKNKDKMSNKRKIPPHKNLSLPETDAKDVKNKDKMCNKSKIPPQKNLSLPETDAKDVKNKDKMCNKRKIPLQKTLSLPETDAKSGNTVIVKYSNKKLVKHSSKSNVQQQRVRSLLKETVENSVDESAVEANERLDSPVKIDIPFSSKKQVLSKFNSEQNLQSLIKNNSSNKRKFSKVLAVQSPNDADVISRIGEIPSHLVFNEKLIHMEQDSRPLADRIARSKSIEKQSRTSSLGNSRTDDDTLSQVTCNSINTKKKQMDDKIMQVNSKKYLTKSAKNVTKHSENSSNVSVLHALNTSIPIDSDEPEIVDMKQATSLHNVPYLMSSSSYSSNVSVLRNALNTSIPIDSNELEIVDAKVDTKQATSFHSNLPYAMSPPSSFEVLSNESFVRKNSITSKLISVTPPKWLSKTHFLEKISLVEQENGDLYMDTNVANYNIKGLNRNICDTIFKLRQEMIIEFQHLNNLELKKRIDHLQQATEETEKVLNFIPGHILNEKLRAINTMRRILDENFQKCDQNITTNDKDDDDDDDDAMLNEWESELSKNLCSTCDKLMKPQSYIVGFSKLPKNDDIYCTCYKYVCHECRSCQDNMVQFVAHQNFHKKREPYVCPDCRLNFTSEKSLEAHVWTVCLHALKKRVFACKICEIDGFRDMESVARHFIIMHSNTKIACETCFKVFSSHGEYKKHAQMHSPVSEQNSVIRLVICRLTGIIMRYDDYMSYLEDFYGIRKLIWFKCPLCPLTVVENKHMTSLLNAHLRNVHLFRLPMLISKEALTLIYGKKYTKLFAKTNKTLSAPIRADIIVPKIVTTETITSETFACVSQDSQEDTKPVKTEEFVDENSQTAEKIDKEKIELLPKILNVRSIVDLKRSESNKTTAKIETKEELSLQTEVTKPDSGNLLREHAKEAIETDNIKPDINKETTNAKSNNESTALHVAKSEKSPSRETNDVHSPLESSKSVSNSDSVSKANTDGRIKVVDIRKICKPDIEPLVVTEQCDLQMKDENRSLLASIPEPPPLARIPQYLLKPTKAENPADRSRDVARSSVCRNDKAKGHIAIHGPTDMQEEDVDYLCHLCGEQINTSWSVVRTHFREKHSDECKLAIISPQLQRISPDFINGGYKQHLTSSKKRKSDSTLFASKKKRRWTPKKYVDLSVPMGLCVERETAEDGEGNFKCKRCDQRCTDMSDLREHIAANHRLKGHYLICLECGENFVVAPSLQMHLKAFHGIEDPIIYMSQNPSYAPDTDGDSEAAGKTTVANQCHVCMAVFEDKAAVDKHLRVHGMAFLNRKRIEARNAQKTPERNANPEKDKRSVVEDNSRETVKRDKPAEAILEKLNAVI